MSNLDLTVPTTGETASCKPVTSGLELNRKECEFQKGWHLHQKTQRLHPETALCPSNNLIVVLQGLGVAGLRLMIQAKATIWTQRLQTLSLSLHRPPRELRRSQDYSNHLLKSGLIWIAPRRWLPRPGAAKGSLSEPPSTWPCRLGC